MTQSIFEIKQNTWNKYYFTFKDATECVRMTSQSFDSRSSLEACISQTRESVIVAEICDEEEHAAPPYFLIRKTMTFSLIGFHGESIFTSTVFSDIEKCLEAIDILKHTAQHAGIIDCTVI